MRGLRGAQYLCIYDLLALGHSPAWKLGDHEVHDAVEAILDSFQVVRRTSGGSSAPDQPMIQGKVANWISQTGWVLELDDQSTPKYHSQRPGGMHVFASTLIGRAKQVRPSD